MSFWSRKEKDPVCGMEVDRKKAAATFDYKDKTFYFCSLRCTATFAKKPRKHLKGPPAAMVGTNRSCH